MAKFTVEINDADKLAGIKAARERRNVELSEDKQLKTDDEYVQFVMDSAAASYATRASDNIAETARMTEEKAKAAAEAKPAKE